MSTLEVKEVMHTNNKKLVIYADVGFDSAHGPYIEGWEVFYYMPGVARNWLVTCNLTTLNYVEFQEVAEALTDLCNRAIINEAMYNDLEQMHINRFNQEA